MCDIPNLLFKVLKFFLLFVSCLIVSLYNFFT